MSERQAAARLENVRKALAGRWANMPTDAEYIEHWKARSRVSERGCWEFMGFRHRKGYAEVSYRGKTYRLHRISYILHKGPIPDGLMICHECDNPSCWNPAHLWAGTMSENALDSARKGRAKEARKTHCPYGHPFAGPNLYVTPRGKRHCRMCARERGRRMWREQPEVMKERLRRARARKRRSVSENDAT